MDERPADFFFAESIAKLDAVVASRELLDGLAAELLGERVVGASAAKKTDVPVVAFHGSRALHASCPAPYPRPPFVDAFEIQVYDATADVQDGLGIELHANAFIRGTKLAESPELPLDRQAHLTLEPSYGVFSWWELGAYLQSAITADGTLRFAGIKLRSKFVTPPRWQKHLRLGLNFEVALLPAAFDRNQWGMEIRPIVAWENEQFLFAINPIVSASLAGPAFGAGPVFEPSGMALYKFGERVSLGFEYYASLGPFSSLSPGPEQEHEVFEVVNVLAVKNVELNFGVGEGLTQASSPFVAKMILGFAWDRYVTPAPR